jgi:hypothetical protein
VQTFSFSAEVFPWDNDGPSWRFVRVPPTMADDIRALPVEPRGFGSIRVEVRIGETTWHTSLFPDKASGSYVLAVKKDVREREGINDGDTVTVAITPQL